MYSYTYKRISWQVTYKLASYILHSIVELKKTGHHNRNTVTTTENHQKLIKI